MSVMILFNFLHFQIEDPYRSPKKLWQFCHFLPEISGDNMNDEGKAKDENYGQLGCGVFCLGNIYYLLRGEY